MIFRLSSWWPVCTFSAQSHLNFQMNLLKVKISKEQKNIFFGLSKVLENIPWPISICLKYFMPSAKTLRPFSPAFFMYGLLGSLQCRGHHTTLLRSESFIFHFINFVRTFKQLFSSKLFFRTTPRISRLGKRSLWQIIVHAMDMVLSFKQKGVVP